MPADTPEKKSGGSFWSRLSPLYKKRLLQGVLAYVLIVALTGLWLWVKADSTRTHWNNRIPQANAPVQSADPQATVEQAVTMPENPPQMAVTATPVNGTQPAIALILTNAGISKNTTTQALNDLPTQVGIAFSPYTDIAALEGFTQQAAAQKRDSLLLIPMEPISYPKDDPGPKALLSRASLKDNARNIEWLLSRTGNIKGSMNYMGSRFLTDSNNLRPLFNALNKNDLLFIENAGGQSRRLAETTARISKTPYIATDIILDTTISEHAIQQQLVALEKIAADRGHALGIIHPYPVSLATVNRWSDTLARRGFRLITPTALWQESTQNEQNRQNGDNTNP